MNQKRLLEEIQVEIIVKNHEKLKQLLSLADFNAINDNHFNDSLLRLAIIMDDHVSVEILLPHVAIPDYNESCTLARSIRNGNLKIIQLLINQGCNPDALLETNNQQDVIPDTIPYNYWYKIVELDNISIFKCLLQCKLRKIDNQQEWSKKILLLACGLGSIKIVEYLLDQGLSVESANEKNWTCLFYAVANWQMSVIDLLINRGANVKHMDFQNNNLLHVIIKNCKCFISRISDDILMSSNTFIQLFIYKSVDINATDINGLTPINAGLAMNNVRVDEIKLLLHQSDIDLSIPDIHGTTFLHRIISTGFGFTKYQNDLDLFRLLLSRLDVDINARDNKGRTPLHFINAKSLKYLSLMLELGADTEGLNYVKDDMFKHKRFMNILKYYQLKRSIANLGKDQNIDTLLAKYGGINKEKCDNYESLFYVYSTEIRKMKETILCDKLTYYDFLHAKKRTCIRVAKISGMFCKLVMHLISDAQPIIRYYIMMLAKNYLYGAKPLPPIDSKAISSTEMNLDILFNNKLPSLVLYNIKKYLDIEDMITLENMNLFCNCDNEK